jgi:predicted NAD/FAD-binding protein
MKIAIIGSGISSLTCAHQLHRQHDVEVFEAGSRIGGHTATVDVAMGGRRYSVDTGFIVYNDWTYPNFIALLEKLGVATQPSSMSFSVSDQLTGLEYGGSNLDTLFAQRSNLVSPRFLGMLRDILKFNKEAPRHLEDGTAGPQMTLGDYLDRHGYGAGFIEQYLVPMGSAIWSADTPAMLGFPLQFFIRFFGNHGLLSVNDRPQWRVIQGGSREYLRPLCDGFRERIHTSSPVTAVRRLDNKVEVEVSGRQVKHFDHVVFGCHSDQALQILQDPSAAERSVLGALPYQDNEVVLHTDVRMLPRNRRTWSSWNYLIQAVEQRAIVTYNMNILQGIQAPETFCVTLNASDSINPHKVLGRFNYAHPVFSLEGIRAQQRWQEINGERTWYCGAYWHNGFHEDGVSSGLRVAQQLGAQQPRELQAAAMGSAA